MRNRFSVLCIVLIIISLLTACGNIITGDKVQTSSSSEQVKQTSMPKSTFGGSASNVAKSSAAQKEEAKTHEEDGAYKITYSNALTYTDSIGTNWVQVITEIENTGTTDLYLSSGSYDLEDKNGKLIASETLVSSYPDVISPGEKGYMYDETILENAADGTLNVIPRPSVRIAKIENTRFNVSDIEISPNKYGGLKALGRVENTSSESSSTTYIVLVLFDENDTPLGLVFSILMDELGAREKRGFEINEMTLPDIVLEKATRYRVYAYPWTMQLF